jgi:hypothetical protein
MDAHKIRDQVPTYVCLFRSFAHDIDIAQLPRGNLSKVESLSLYKCIYYSLSSSVYRRERERKRS